VAIEKGDSIVNNFDNYVAHYTQQPSLFYLCTTFTAKGIENPDYAATIIEQLERDIETLSLQILYQCFQVQVGDWVASNVLKRGKTIQLVVASASYSDGWLFINGTHVTQKGVLGKREERIALKVLRDEH